jgi:protein disulfide-isomerase
MNLIIPVVVLLVIFVGIFIYRRRSQFADVSNLPATSYVFYAPWCGHCKKSMGEFKKANEMDSSVVLVDTTNKSNDELVKKYKVKGFPTIIRVSDNEIYKGPRTANEIVEFAKGK